MESISSIKIDDIRPVNEGEVKLNLLSDEDESPFGRVQ